MNPAGTGRKPLDSGLAGFVAAETVLSHSDGARGILWVRGYTLPDLVARFGYDGAVGLLWEGFAGDGIDRDTPLRVAGYRCSEPPWARV